MALILKRSVSRLFNFDFSRQFPSIYHRSKGVFFSTATRPSEDELRAMYEKYLVDHGKSYKTAHEKERRFEIFKKKLTMFDKPDYRTGLVPSHPAPWPMGTELGWNPAVLKDSRLRAIWAVLKDSRLRAIWRRAHEMAKREQESAPKNRDSAATATWWN